MASAPAQPTAKRLGRPKRTTKHPAWEHPPKSGIRIFEIPNVTRGKVFGQSFLVVIPRRLTGTKQEKRSHNDKADAFRFAEDRALALRKHGTSFSELPPKAQREAAIAWGELKEAGIGFLEAVRTGLRTLRPEGGTRTVAQVVGELCTAKELRLANGQLRASTPADFKAKTTPLVRDFGDKPIAQLTRDDVLAYLTKLATKGEDGERLAPTSVWNHHKHLRQVLKYAMERGYTPENPLKRLSREELDTYGGEQKTQKAIEFLTVAESHALLKSAEAHPEFGLLASMAIQLFCGVRTEELCRLQWSDVRKIGKRTFISVAEDKAKTGAHGEVDVPPNARAWLARCGEKTGPIAPTADSAEYSHAVLRLRKAAAEEYGLPKLANTEARRWNSITRHTMGTMSFAAYGDALLTAHQLRHQGNPQMLFGHYRAMGVSKETGRAFFKLRPGQKIGAEVVSVKFSAKA